MRVRARTCARECVYEAAERGFSAYQMTLLAGLRRRRRRTRARARDTMHAPCQLIISSRFPPSAAEPSSAAVFPCLFMNIHEHIKERSKKWIEKAKMLSIYTYRLIDYYTIEIL